MRSRLKSRALDASALAIVLAALATAPAAAIAAPAKLNFAIAPGPLETALLAYAAQASVQVLFEPGLVQGRRTEGLRGAFTPDAALERLIAGGGIVARQTRPGVIVLRAAVLPARGPAIASAGSPPPEAALPDAAAAAVIAPEALDELVVTGTHIRGVGEGPAPLQVLTREDIDRSGHATIADALTALPQNFAGAATPLSALAGADTSGVNAAFATGVNLRGLGADATLVLVNGRRMGGSGAKGDFADVSAIPTAAVERTEILLDGASALYGSDAVGGVVNIILRRDFEGAETRLRIGGAADGAQERQFGQTFGKTWADGYALISYEGLQRESLAYADRDATRTADLTRFGGRDHRTPYAHPGNVMQFDPVTFSLTPGWAIPAGRTGESLAPADFIAGAANLGEPNEGADLLPEQTRHSVYAAAGHTLGSVELSADARYSRRTFDYGGPPPVSAFAVSLANPHFASPTGAPFEFISYSFARDLGASRGSGSSESLGLSAAASRTVGATWKVEGYAAYAREESRSRTTSLNSAHLEEALGNVPDDPATAFDAARDGYFDPFGDGAMGDPDVLAFIGDGFTEVRFANSVGSANLMADGTLASWRAGDVKLALGAQVRRETFTQDITSYRSTPSPVVLPGARYRRTVSAAFAELRAPLIAPAAAGEPARLELSVAGRVESYDDVGSTADPKVGLIWRPGGGLSLRTTYGTSFRAPALAEVFEAKSIGTSLLPAGNGRLLTLIRYGGNAELEPETAVSWTAGVDFRPQAAPDLTLSATWFETRFDDQIGQPAFQNLLGALDDPTLSPFVRRIDPSNSADLAGVSALINDPSYTGAPLSPDAFGAILDARYVNTAKLTVAGLDLAARYVVRRGEDRVGLGVNATYLSRYERQLTPSAPAFNLAGVAGHPADWRAQAFADWSRGPLGAGLTFHYVGDAEGPLGEAIDDWLTVDVQLRWSPVGERLGGLVVALTVQNLFDEDPPFYDAPQGVAYDPANTDPIGRFVALQLTKRW